MARTMFEAYGGFGKLSKVVMAFYDRVVDSDGIGHYFDGVPMRRLIDHQTQFVAQLMGGPLVYSDDMLRHVHAHLGIEDDGFDVMLELFQETLEDFEFDPDDARELTSLLERKRPLIVKADAAATGTGP